MTGTICATWTIDPITRPRPRRHCSTCGTARLFRSSGKVRLNASGRRLDAWLIYRCETCDRTWNLPLAERVAVAAIAPGDLQAMQHSDPAWVRAREDDQALLRRYCDSIDLSPDLTVRMTVEGAVPDDWAVVLLTIEARGPTGQRLDRLLASRIGVSRSAVQAMLAAGGLEVPGPSGRPLGRPVSGRMRLRFVACRMTGDQRERVTASLRDGRPGPAPDGMG
ncbi:MAG: DUF1062 domain-containing protein [Paracoccaceae bacterium]|nr:MAG: DUF1062 domain-containing protein [Paracoccaceae bacterium]